MIVGSDGVELGRAGVLLVDCGAQDALVHVDLSMLRFASGTGENGPNRGDLIHSLVVSWRPGQRGRQGVGVVLGFGLADGGLLLTLAIAGPVQISPLRQLGISGHVVVGILNVIQRRHRPIHARLLVHVAELRLAAESIVLWNRSRVLCTVFSALAGELLDVEADLLGQ